MSRPSTTTWTANDTAVASHDAVFSVWGAGISPTRRCAFGLAPLNSDPGIPTTDAMVDEPLLNRNRCNKGASAKPLSIDEIRRSPVLCLGRAQGLPGLRDLP